MQIASLLLSIAVSAARHGTPAHPAPLAWSERVDVTARAPRAAALAARIADGSAPDALRLGASGPDLARWTTLASRATGRTTGATLVRVDGVDGGALPAAGSIGAIEFGADPFSAATASASLVTIDITTAPRTRWQISGAPGLTAVRARDPLAGGPAPRSTSRSVDLGGPLRRGRTSIAFSAATASDIDVPTYADATGTLRLANQHDHSSASWTTGITHAAGGFLFGLSGGLTTSRDTGAGVGGEQGPSGALALSGRNAFSRASVSGRVGDWSVRAAAGLDVRRDTAESASSTQGIVFAGLLVDGAPDVVARGTASRAFRAQLRASATAGRFSGWRVGVDAARDDVEDTRAFNPGGQLIVTAPGARTGVFIGRDRDGTAREASTTTALFAERVAIDTDRLWVRPGARLTRTARSTALDPRVTIGVNAGVLLFSAAAGTYTEPSPLAVELERRLQQTTGEYVIDPSGRRWDLVTAGIEGDRRDAIIRIGAGRVAGAVTLAIDQTWRAGWHLAGLTRAIGDGAMIDTLDLTRQRREHNTQASVTAAARDWNLAAHYTFSSARDNTDGALTFGPDPSRTSPWAAAGQIPRHAASLVVTGAIARDYRVILSAHAESGLAYSRATGADPRGQFTFSGLEGERHGFWSAGSRDVSAYLARSVRIPRARINADIGLRIENLLNDLTPMAISQTSGSTRAGQAVLAGAGRSASVWATFNWR